MASQEAWVGIADVAAHLSVARIPSTVGSRLRTSPRIGWDVSCASDSRRWTIE